MNSFAEFLVHQFNPRTLDELTPEPDEVTSLVYLEDSIAKEVRTITAPTPILGGRSDPRPAADPSSHFLLPPLAQLNSIRDYNKNKRPLGQPAAPEDVPSEPEEDPAAAGPATSDDEPSSAGDFEESADEIEEPPADDGDVEMIGGM